MSDPPAIIFQEFRRYRRQYVEYSDGTKLTRRVHKATFVPLTPWTAVLTTTTTTAASSPLHLSLVVENRPSPAAATPQHWSLLCHRADDTRGRVWQVVGDDERSSMRYAHELDAERLGGGGDGAWHQVLNAALSAAQRATVEEVVGTEPPPRAPQSSSAAAAHGRENSQGWVLRVLRRLAAEGIVEETQVDELRERMDPVK